MIIGGFSRIFSTGYMICLGLLMAPQIVAADSQKIRIPIFASGSDTFISYYLDLLVAACERTEEEFGKCEISQSEDFMNHRRAMEELSKGTIDLYLRAYIADQYEDSLDLVPFPLDKGLLGHRIALIHADSQKAIDTIGSLDDLKNFSIGQGDVWLDSDILESAGLNVVRSTSYDGLFSMVASGRIDLFTRGLNEVRGEYLNRRIEYPKIAIERSLIISYPMSFYFIVRKGDEGQKIKHRLTIGLDRMVKDGGYERRFKQLLDDVLEGQEISERRIIRVPNIFYDRPEYRVNDPSMWVDLDKLK